MKETFMEQQVLDDPRVNEALNLLNDVAKEKKDQLQRLVTERYADVKNLISGSTGALESSASGTIEKSVNVVKRNIWPFLGGVAAVFLVAGYLIRGIKD
jgi:ElaB/YqjD/DUF883 family membrane-anchored ribosome-binding protein